MSSFRLKDFLSFGKPKTPGYGISKDCFLTALAARAQLPNPSQVVAPEPQGGALPGFIAPLEGEKNKEVLEKPIERGAWVVASLDRRTVLKLRVLPKEEAGFDPTPFVRSDFGQLFPVELRNRVAATWMVMQLSFEAHDPMVVGSIRFLNRVAARLAELTEGVVTDPLAMNYLLPDDPMFRVNADRLKPEEVISVRNRTESDGYAVFSAGLKKLAVAELEITKVGPSNVDAATRLIVAAAHRILDQGPLTAGDVLSAGGAEFEVCAGGFNKAQWEGVPCLELMPVKGTDVNDALLQMDAGK